MFGAEVYNEAKLSEKLALRSQLALYPSLWGGNIYNKTGFALTPAISLTPKYYYNLRKRADAGKNQNNNAGNYISLKVEYLPNWFVISNVEDIYVTPMISFVPTWGLRRNLAIKLGLGVGKILGKENHTQIVPDISFKIGYDF